MGAGAVAAPVTGAARLSRETMAERGDDVPISRAASAIAVRDGVQRHDVVGARGQRLKLVDIVLAQLVGEEPGR